MLKNTFLKLLYSFMPSLFNNFYPINEQHTADFVFFTYLYFQHFDGPLKHNTAVYRWKAYEKTNNLAYDMLKSVAKCGSYRHFS